MITLSRIFVYPIKSTAPVELREAQAHERGLEHDRRYVVTDTQGRFFTARRFPRMVLINCAIAGDGLVVSAADQPELALNPADFPDDYDPIRVWNDTVAGQRCGAAADTWFTGYLGTEARLYYMGAQSRREIRDGSGEVSFADGAPLLALSEASVADLNTRLDRAVSIRNFRPNLVVSGAQAYGEDDWPDFDIGSTQFRALWRCSRCVLTTVDPDTAIKSRDGQPLKTLFDYRQVENEALFGRNVGVRVAGMIAVGDRLRFKDRG